MKFEDYGRFGEKEIKVQAKHPGKSTPFQWIHEDLRNSSKSTC